MSNVSWRIFVLPFEKASRLCGLLLIAFALLFEPGSAWSQAAYPTKPIRFIQPFSPGGSSDLLSRILSQKLAESLGQPVVMDYRPGAGGNIGMEAASKAAPDGYTIVLAYNGTMAINPALYSKLPYDPIEDFAPISLFASSQLALAAHPSVPAKSIPELIALAKSRPQPLTYASGGTGTGPHLAAELFKTTTGIDLLHVPYKGSGPALNDVLGGHVQLAFLPVVTVLPYAKNGELNVLGVTGQQRLSAVPDWPPIAEFLPNYEYTSWFGLLAPANTPADIIAKLNNAVRQAMEDPAVVERFTGEGVEVVTDTPQEFASYIADEIRKWRKVVQDANTRLD